MSNRRSTPASVRLLNKFVRNTETGCWEWIASKGVDGYGRINVSGTPRMAHRVSYESYIGPIPPGLDIDHLCRNRGCINPKHLEPVTRAENLRRSDAATGRRSAATHCPSGHEYTPENTYRHADGKRVCRACRISRAAAYKKRKSSSPATAA